MANLTYTQSLLSDISGATKYIKILINGLVLKLTDTADVILNFEIGTLMTSGTVKIGDGTTIGHCGIDPTDGCFYTVYLADETLVAGDVVHLTVGTGNPDGVTKCPVSGDGNGRPIGAVLAGAASGQKVKIATKGRVAIYFDSAPTKGYLAITSGTNAGRADQTNAPDAATNHWRELGHITGASVSRESRTLYYVESHQN